MKYLECYWEKNVNHSCLILNPFNIREKIIIGKERCYKKVAGKICKIENKFWQVVAKMDSLRMQRTIWPTTPALWVRVELKSYILGYNM